MIIDEMIVEFLVENGYFYIMYWFDEVVWILFIKKMKKCGLIILISVGVKKEEYFFIEKLVEELLNFDYIIIDIVYGYVNLVIDMI